MRLLVLDLETLPLTARVWGLWGVNIGINQIVAAARGGAVSVAAIGEALEAGTQCGSCRSEIGAILARLAQEEAGHAPIVQAV